MSAMCLLSFDGCMYITSICIRICTLCDNVMKCVI